MNISRILLVILARYKLIALTLIITVLTTLVISLLLPNNYKATALLLLLHKGTDPVTGATLHPQLRATYMTTELDIIKSARTALMVVDQLQLDRSEVIREQYEESGSDMPLREWTAARLLKNLEIEASRDSSVIGISFYGTDPLFASTLANAFANAYQELSIRLTVEPSKKAANYFTEQLNVLRNRMEAAQIKLSQYQHDKGIVDVDLRLDVETRRLNDLSSQLVAAQTELMGVTSEYDSYVSQNTRNMASRDPIINNLKMNVAQAESRFSEFSQKVGKNHPSYISTQAELDQLRIELDRSIRNATKAIVNREAEIRSALEQQRTKVLTLNQARSELMLLVREVEGAQQAYNGAMQRLNQTSLEGQSTLSGVSILDTAKVPDKPHSPILWLNLILSIILGVLLGLGLGLLAEMIDRRVRSADDLFDVLQVPVLGVVKQGTGNHQQEKRVQFTWPHLLRSN